MLSAPLTAGHPNAYVVIVPGSLEVARYVWRVTLAGAELATLTTAIGRSRWIPPPSATGGYQIEVDLIASGGERIETLALPPQAVGPKPHIRPKALLDILNAGGTPRQDMLPTARYWVVGRVLCDLRRHLQREATAHGLPVKLLAALLYVIATRAAPARLIDEIGFVPPFRRPGLFEVKPVPHATALSARVAHGPSQILPERVAAMRGLVADKGAADRYAGVDEAARLAIHADLRFPSSNAAALCDLLEFEIHTWHAAVPDASKGKLPRTIDLGTPDGCKALAAIYAAGGSLAAAQRLPGDATRFGAAVEAAMRLGCFEAFVDEVITPAAWYAEAMQEWASGLEWSGGQAGVPALAWIPADGLTRFETLYADDAVAVHHDAPEQPLTERGVRRRFEFGILQYLHVRKLYQEQGPRTECAEGDKDPAYLQVREQFKNPFAWIRDHIVRYEFDPQPGNPSSRSFVVYLHRELIAPLKDVSDAFSLVGSLDGGFCPRGVAGNAAKISYHALGRAFDVDPASNPLIDMPVLRAIAELVGPAVWTPGYEDGYAKMKALHEQFLRQLVLHPEYVMSVDVDAADVPAPGRYFYGEVGAILAIQRGGGIMTLAQDFVDRLTSLWKDGRPHFEWGGRWKSRKDSMHFERRP